VDWNWSFHAFRWSGIDVRIHWSLPAFFLYYVTRHFGLRVGHMILTPIGGMVMVAQGQTPTHELVVAIAGPAVNFVLALLASALYLALGGPPSLGLILPFAGVENLHFLYGQERWLELVLFDFASSQAMLVAFNLLLTAYPMDGGRVLMSILWRRRGFHAALVASCKIARVLAVLLGIAGVLTARPALAFIAFFVFFQAQTTLKQAPLLPDPGGWRAPPRPSKKPKPWFWVAWWRERQQRRLRSLLARAEAKGIASLSPSEREWLRRMREER
jgi:Zn-dependent protease